jgi:hypothetical protein
MVVVGALWTVILQALKADLEDKALWQWMARKLIYAAAQRLPHGQRARYREEWMRHQLDLEGRIPRVVHALGVYARAGSWSRMLRGAPSPSQALIARLRAAWGRLRAQVEARARTRSKQRHPAFSTRAQAQVEAQQARVVRSVALDAILASGTTRSTGSASLVPRPGTWFPIPGGRDGMPHLSDRDFVRWLAQERRDFEDSIDRKFEEWRQRRDQELGS